ncbi:hypothetical protein KC360_g107 [Hortaea werneckii]|nr:hypothetical protein KC360_g107 [Hortaea werneckii]
MQVDNRVAPRPCKVRPMHGQGMHQTLSRPSCSARYKRERSRQVTPRCIAELAKELTPAASAWLVRLLKILNAEPRRSRQTKLYGTSYLTCLELQLERICLLRPPEHLQSLPSSAPPSTDLSS